MASNRIGGVCGQLVMSAGPSKERSKSLTKPK